MDEKQQVDAADDLQDALASMMAVEPSPEFASRVRQRIAGNADVRQGRFVSLVLPGLAAAAVVVLGVLFVFTGTRRIAPERLMPAATRDSEPAPVESAPSSEPAAVVVVQQEERPTALVPRNEIVAIQRLLSAAQAGRFEFELVPAGLPIATELSPPGPISLPPIEMMPIGTSSSFE
jgi:hypothetical protein